MQNIKVTKKKFNFEIFRNNDKNLGKESKTVVFKGDVKKPIQEVDDIISQNLFKDNDIKLKLMGGLESLRSPDHYRDIIKSKTKIENSHRVEYLYFFN